MGLPYFRHSMLSSILSVIGFFLLAAHIFKISNGEIHEIAAMGFISDYNAPTDWSVNFQINEIQE